MPTHAKVGFGKVVQQLIAFSDEHDAARRMHLYEHLLNAIATHRVGNRPGRFEPRQ